MDTLITAYGTIITGLLGGNMALQLFFLRKLIDHERRISVAESEINHLVE